jgi:hypothetical protein
MSPVIGYSGEDFGHAGLVEGLRRRWCPDVTVEIGATRGSTAQSHRREIRKICLELSAKGADLIIFLTDADTQDWSVVQKREFARVPTEHQHHTILTVADRNVESWFCLVPEYPAKLTGKPISTFQIADPKKAFHREFEVSGRTDPAARLDKLADYVKQAPVAEWIDRSPSFARLYDDTRRISKHLGCNIPNERERQPSKG